MRTRFFGQAALAASILRHAVAQDSVPSDLKAGFESSGKELQVSYTGNAVEGFLDGTTFEKDDVSKEPEFALGDSSGISSTTLYTILMVDTTDDNARTLHYARSNFKYNFDITNLETQDQPLFEYKAPGAFGETGDDRKYTFLMYSNPGRKEITSLKLPGEGETFDVKQFQDDNGLSDAGAGLGMTVKLGSQSSPSQSSSAPESSSAPKSSSAASSSASAKSGTSTTSAASRTSSGASSTAAGDSQSESSSANGQTSATDLAPASTVLQSSASAPSASVSTVSTSVVPGATGSSSTSGAPAQSTGAGASLSLGMAHGMMIASLVAFAGVLAWH